MPHDVTMPQLGMAQDAGKIVSWLKAPGDAVAKGDALFEVETDKAVMEVEAPAAGFLTDVAAAEGDDVPVGHVIARISDSADDSSAPAASTADKTPETPDADTDADDPLPSGHLVTMPQLGMAQDTGLLVTWLKAPGDAVSVGDILFEVETDKSTMEVEAGRDGWLAATLAEAGEEVPVGEAVAIISAEKPDATVARSAKQAGAGTPAPAPKAEAPAAASPPKAKPADPAPLRSQAHTPVAPGGRILASPKARRLALERGLDLNRLVKAGHPQPFHVADLEVLQNLPNDAPPAATHEAPRHLTARCTENGLAEFLDWASGTTDDPDAILAGLAGASLGSDQAVTVSVERFGASQSYTVPPKRTLADVSRTEDAPGLILRDLRSTRLSAIAMGAETVPVLTITTEGQGLSVTLECAASHLDAGTAIELLTEFAGRLEHPLRHLL